MNPIRIRTTVTSDTLHLPELRDFIGKLVEVSVIELPRATREDVIYEAAHVPETPEEAAAQQALFRSWLADPCYEHYWPMIARMVDPPTTRSADSVAADDPARHQSVVP